MVNCTNATFKSHVQPHIARHRSFAHNSFQFSAQFSTHTKQLHKQSQFISQSQSIHSSTAHLVFFSFTIKAHISGQAGHPSHRHKATQAVIHRHHIHITVSQQTAHSRTRHTGSSSHTRQFCTVTQRLSNGIQAPPVVSAGTGTHMQHKNQHNAFTQQANHTLSQHACSAGTTGHHPHNNIQCTTIQQPTHTFTHTTAITHRRTFTTPSVQRSQSNSIHHIAHIHPFSQFTQHHASHQQSLQCNSFSSSSNTHFSSFRSHTRALHTQAVKSHSHTFPRCSHKPVTHRSHLTDVPCTQEVHCTVVQGTGTQSHRSAHHMQGISHSTSISHIITASFPGPNSSTSHQHRSPFSLSTFLFMQVIHAVQQHNMYVHTCTTFIRIHTQHHHSTSQHTAGKHTQQSPQVIHSHLRAQATGQHNTTLDLSATRQGGHSQETFTHTGTWATPQVSALTQSHTQMCFHTTHGSRHIDHLHSRQVTQRIARPQHTTSKATAQQHNAHTGGISAVTHKSHIPHAHPSQFTTGSNTGPQQGPQQGAWQFQQSHTSLRHHNNSLGRAQAGAHNTHTRKSHTPVRQVSGTLQGTAGKQRFTLHNIQYRSTHIAPIDRPTMHTGNAQHRSRHHAHDKACTNRASIHTVNLHTPRSTSQHTRQETAQQQHNSMHASMQVMQSQLSQHQGTPRATSHSSHAHTRCLLQTGARHPSPSHISHSNAGHTHTLQQCRHNSHRAHSTFTHKGTHSHTNNSCHLRTIHATWSCTQTSQATHTGMHVRAKAGPFHSTHRAKSHAH